MMTEPINKTIRLEPIGQDLEAHIGVNILGIAQINDIHIKHDCGGHGVCGTCRFKVLSGDEYLSRKTHDEVELPADSKLSEGERLGCQTLIKTIFFEDESSSIAIHCDSAGKI